MSKLMSKTSILIVVSIVAVAGIGSSTFLYAQYQKAENQNKNPEAAAQEEVNSVKKKISRHMMLPAGEEPTVATVSDTQKLSDQPFFKNATNGDKVLIYGKEKIAILYDPKKDLIIAVSSLNITQDTQAQGATQNQETAVLGIDIRNGTLTAGLAQRVADDLKKNSSYSVQKIEDANKKTYKKTVVVDLGKFSDKSVLSSLATELHAELLDALPADEPAGTADALVIVGTDGAGD